MDSAHLHFATLKTNLKPIPFFVALQILLLSFNCISQTQIGTTLPIFNCRKNITIDCDPGTTFAKVIYTRPTATKDGKSIPVKLLVGMESGSNFPVGITKMLFEARDENGNKSECAFTITVGCPGNEFTMYCPETTVKDNEFGKCGAAVSYNAPYSVGNSTQVQITQPEGLRSGSFFNVGITTNTFRGTLNGNTKDCSFTVRIVDNELPQIMCPPDIVVPTGKNAKGAGVNYIFPTATDNCRVKEIKLISGLPSGSFFPQGTTEMNYRAYDESGNFRNCFFKIEIAETDTAKETPKPAETKKTFVAAPVVIDEKLNVGSDSVVTSQSLIVLKSCDVTLCIYDDAQEDGDSVSIIFNDQILVDRKLIRVLSKKSLKNAFRIPIHLNTEGTNFLISKAWNMGSIPPNTLKIDIYDGHITDEKKLRELKPIVSKKLSSRPGLAGGILLKCNADK